MNETNKFKLVTPKEGRTEKEIIYLKHREDRYDEVQEHTDGNDAGSTKTDTSAP